jgi:hypothetical protein
MAAGIRNLQARDQRGSSSAPLV